MTSLEQTVFVEGAIGAILSGTIKDPATDAALDISAATSVKWHYQKPDATTGSWTCSFVTDGTDGQITYTTIADDLDVAGLWIVEAEVISPTQNFRTVTQPRFRVRGKIGG